MATRRHLTLVTDTGRFYGNGRFAGGLSGDIVDLENGLWSVLVCTGATTITINTECHAPVDVVLDAGSVIYFHAPDASISVDKAVVLNHVGISYGIGRSTGIASTSISTGIAGIH